MPRSYRITTVREDSKPNNNGRVNYWIELARNALAITVALSAIFGAIGFLIVNFYLSIVTEIHGFTIVPGRYISATIWLLAGVLIASCLVYAGWFYTGFVQRLKNPYDLIFMSLLIILVVAIMVIVISILSGGGLLYHLLLFAVCSFVYPAIIRFYIFDNLNIWLIRGFITLSVLVIIGTIAYFFIFIYPNVPQYFGGGRPSVVQLILEENNITKQLPLDFISGTFTTEPIGILSELTDGLLIRDAQGNTMVIKNEHIGAILDIQTTPTPMQGISSTATSSPAITLTATPTP